VTTQDIKEELSKGIENLRKKNQTEIMEIKTYLVKPKTQWKDTPADYKKWKTESPSLKIN
jgi:hypothetical protein